MWPRDILEIMFKIWKMYNSLEEINIPLVHHYAIGIAI